MNLTVQFQTLFAMIVMGIVLGATLDTYKRFVNRYKKSVYIIFFYDIIYWCGHALLLFYILYRINYGEVQFYLFLAIICGFSFYQVFLKKMYGNILESIIIFIRQLFMYLYKIVQIFIIRPIYFFFLLIYHIIIFITKAFLGLVNSLRIVVIWLIQIIFYPLFIIGRIIWKLLPNNFRKYCLFIKKKWMNCKQKMTEFIKASVAFMRTLLRSFK